MDHAMEAPVRRDDRSLLLERQRKIQAVIDWMVEIVRQSRSGRHELPHRAWHRQGRIGQQVERFADIGSADLAATGDRPQRVRRLGVDELWRRKGQVVIEEPGCLRGQRLVDQPFDRDARVDHKPRHAGPSCGSVTIAICAHQRRTVDVGAQTAA